MRAFANLAARTQMRVRSEDGVVRDLGLIDDASRPDLHVVADSRIADDAVRTNAAIGAYAALAQDLHKRFNHGVGGDRNIGVDRAGLGPVDGDPFSHQRIAFARAQLGVE